MCGTFQFPREMMFHISGGQMSHEEWSFCRRTMMLRSPSSTQNRKKAKRANMFNSPPPQFRLHRPLSVSCINVCTCKGFLCGANAAGVESESCHAQGLIGLLADRYWEIHPSLDQKPRYYSYCICRTHTSWCENQTDSHPPTICLGFWHDFNAAGVPLNISQSKGCEESVWG